MQAKLVALEHAGEDILLRSFPVVIGRNPDSGIAIDDRWVSRRHCEIDEADGVLVVRDLGSKHGTLVNNEAIVEAKLFPGDKLSLGMTSFVASYKVPDELTPPVESEHDAARSGSALS